VPQNVGPGAYGQHCERSVRAQDPPGAVLETSLARAHPGAPSRWLFSMGWSLSQHGSETVSGVTGGPLAGTAARRRRALAHLSPIFELHLNRSRNPSEVAWSARGSWAGQACCADAVRGCPRGLADRSSRARTYSGQRRRSKRYPVAFAQVGGHMEMQAGEYCKPSAQPTLVRTQHLPPVTIGSTTRSAPLLETLSRRYCLASASGLQTAALAGRMSSRQVLTRAAVISHGSSLSSIMFAELRINPGDLHSTVRSGRRSESW
jgi:hypothetical protein